MNTIQSNLNQQPPSPISSFQSQLSPSILQSQNGISTSTNNEEQHLNYQGIEKLEVDCFAVISVLENELKSAKEKISKLFQQQVNQTCTPDSQKPATNKIYRPCCSAAIIESSKVWKRALDDEREKSCSLLNRCKELSEMLNKSRKNEQTLQQNSQEDSNLLQSRSSIGRASEHLTRPRSCSPDRGMLLKTIELQRLRILDNERIMLQMQGDLETVQKHFKININSDPQLDMKSARKTSLNTLNNDNRFTSPSQSFEPARKFSLNPNEDSQQSVLQPSTTERQKNPSHHLDKSSNHIQQSSSSTQKLNSPPPHSPINGFYSPMGSAAPSSSKGAQAKNFVNVISKDHGEEQMKQKLLSQIYNVGLVVDDELVEAMSQPTKNQQNGGTSFHTSKQGRISSWSSTSMSSLSSSLAKKATPSTKLSPQRQAQLSKKNLLITSYPRSVQGSVQYSQRNNNIPVEKSIEIFKKFKTSVDSLTQL